MREDGRSRSPVWSRVCHSVPASGGFHGSRETGSVLPGNKRFPAAVFDLKGRGTGAIGALVCPGQIRAMPLNATLAVSVHLQIADLVRQPVEQGARPFVQGLVRCDQYDATLATRRIRSTSNSAPVLLCGTSRTRPGSAVSEAAGAGAHPARPAARGRRLFRMRIRRLSFFGNFQDGKGAVPDRRPERPLVPFWQ